MPTISNTLLYAGSIVITLWGISHTISTKSVVEGFGSISEEDKLIITMEWAAEGLTLLHRLARIAYHHFERRPKLSVHYRV